MAKKKEAIDTTEYYKKPVSDGTKNYIRSNEIIENAQAKHLDGGLGVMAKALRDAGYKISKED